jgi:hypothetical protein
MENWKDIKGYEGLYQVSDLGRVKSLRRSVHNSSNGGYFIDEKILKQSNGGNNYFVVGLSKNMKSKSFYVHRLVAETFLIKKENLVIDHLNNISTDNRLVNLQYISQRENLSKDKKGTSKYTGAYWKPQDKKWISSIYLNGKKMHLGSFDSEERASIAYNFALMQMDKLKEYNLTK